MNVTSEVSEELPPIPDLLGVETSLRPPRVPDLSPAESATFPVARAVAAVDLDDHAPDTIPAPPPELDAGDDHVDFDHD